MSEDKKVIYESTSKRGGFALGKVLGLLLVAGVVGGGVYTGNWFLNKEEKKEREQKHYVAKKADFRVTVKLTGRLVSTDVEVLKCELEGQTTIKTVIDEGETVDGPSDYVVAEGDTLESIATIHDKFDYCIKQLNSKLEIDWDNLESGTEIQLPGTLLVELDPQSLNERISNQRISVQRAENNLSRAEGNKETLILSSALALKVAENSYTNAVMQLDQLENSTFETYIQQSEGDIENLKTDVELAEKNLAAYTKLKELGFVSDVEVLRQISLRDKAQHQIKMRRADLEAYRKYDIVSLRRAKELTVDETQVQIEKQKVLNKANMRDAESNILTAQETLKLEREKLEDLNEQMANTKIYAPQDGTVLYWSARHHHHRSEPIIEGARVYRGTPMIKLPRTKSLKVDISVPQAKHKSLYKGMRAYIEVEDVKLPGTLSYLSPTVDNNQRGHTDKSYFKGEVSIDTTNYPDSVSEGMTVTVELVVVNLKGKNQRIKVPNQCVTTRMVDKDTPERGCWVLDPATKKHRWRPVKIEYSDEQFIAIKEETDPNRGLREGELVHLSPLSKAENLNLEEAVMGKGEVDLKSKTEVNVTEEESPMALLKITDQQKTAWNAARTKAKAAFDQVITRASVGEIRREEITTAQEKVGDDFRAEVKAFLTQEQLQKFDQQKAKNIRVLFAK